MNPEKRPTISEIIHRLKNPLFSQQKLQEKKKKEILMFGKNMKIPISSNLLQFNNFNLNDFEYDLVKNLAENGPKFYQIYDKQSGKFFIAKMFPREDYEELKSLKGVLLINAKSIIEK